MSATRRPYRILVVADADDDRILIASRLERLAESDSAHEIQATYVRGVDAAHEILLGPSDAAPHMMVLDLGLPGRPTAYDLLRSMESLRCVVHTLVLAGSDDAIECVPHRDWIVRLPKRAALEPGQRGLEAAVSVLEESADASDLANRINETARRCESARRRRGAEGLL